MKDTPNSFLEKWNERISSLPGEERLQMACSMFEFSRDVVVESIRSQNKEISATDLMRQVFLRFYASDFDPATLQRILHHLESTSDNSKH